MHVWELPLHSLYDLIMHNRNFFSCRGSKVAVVNLPWLVEKAIGFVRGFLNVSQKKQLSFHGTSFEDALLDHISPDNLEQRYGGDVPDL